MAEKEFYWIAYDEGDHQIMPRAAEVMAKDMTHAMQKVASALPADAAKVSVWENLW